MSSDFFSSWAFILIMAVLLVGLLGVCSLLGIAALVIIARNRRNREEP